MPNMNSTESFDIIMNTVSLLSSFQSWGGLSDACQRSWWLVPTGKFGVLIQSSTAIAKCWQKAGN